MGSETILAVDPALRAAGFAVLVRDRNKVACSTFGVIRNQARLAASDCLLALHEGITAIIRQHEPQAMAVEGII